MYNEAGDVDQDKRGINVAYVNLYIFVRYSDS